MKKFLNENLPAVVGNINSSGIRNRYRSNISELLFRNRLVFFISVAAILTGGIVGGIIYSCFPQESKNLIFSYMQNYFTGSVIVGASHAELFKKAVYEGVFTGAFIALCGIITVLYPLAFLRLFSKGFSMGFTVTFLIARYGAKGFVFSLVSVLLRNIIIICVMVWFIISISEIRKRSPKERRKKSLLRFFPGGKEVIQILFYLIIFLSASTISAIFESYIVHGLLMGIYSIFTA